MKARTNLLQKLKEVFRDHKSQPIWKVINIINPILRGWTNYFRIGNSGRNFNYVKLWVEKKVRRKLMKARKAKGYNAPHKLDQKKMVDPSRKVKG